MRSHAGSGVVAVPRRAGRRRRLFEEGRHGRASFRTTLGLELARLTLARIATDSRLKIGEIEKHIGLTAQIVGKDAAWVPLFSLDHSYVVQPRVKNFTVPWNGWSDMNYHNVEVE